MKQFQHILVPVDFSDHTSRVVDYAVGFARRYGARIRLLHVIQADRYVLPGHYMLPGPELLERIAAEMELKLAALSKGLLTTGAPVECEVRRGLAIPTILEAARDVAADLIVMGTHGHTGIKHLWIGSVAENIVRTAPCPVLTVRARDGASR
jgi:universal stress protein A